MTILLMAVPAILVMLASWALAARSAKRQDDRLCDPQLRDIYRREHQRLLDGRAAFWE